MLTLVDLIFVRPQVLTFCNTFPLNAKILDFFANISNFKELCILFLSKIRLSCKNVSQKQTQIFKTFNRLSTENKSAFYNLRMSKKTFLLKKYRQRDLRIVNLVLPLKNKIISYAIK